jgi:hypothetical protein
MLPYGLRADLQIPKQACQTQRGRVGVGVVGGARGGGGSGQTVETVRNRTWVPNST